MSNKNNTPDLRDQKKEELPNLGSGSAELTEEQKSDLGINPLGSAEEELGISGVEYEAVEVGDTVEYFPDGEERRKYDISDETESIDAAVFAVENATKVSLVVFPNGPEKNGFAVEGSIYAGDFEEKTTKTWKFKL